MPVSVEIMDAMTGRPGEGLRLALCRRDSQRDGDFEDGLTRYADAQGRATWPDSLQNRGVYRLTVDLDAYFGALGVEPFQSRLEFEFRVFEPGETVGLMLTVSPTSLLLSRLASGRED